MARSTKPKRRAEKPRKKQPNAKAAQASSRGQRAPRVLWANSYCMLDTSSGASISVRQILIALSHAGYEIEVVGATIFDDAKGASTLYESDEYRSSQLGDAFVIEDAKFKHFLVKTKSAVRSQITQEESGILYNLYIQRLESFKPDLVFFYGGQISDLLIPLEARVRGIPSAAYLVNANYQSRRWCRDVDLIITDTQATSDFYFEKQGFRPVPVGKFIDPASVIAPKHTRKHATLINPSFAKGAGVVAMLALHLEKTRPDITFEVVESRGNWQSVVASVTNTLEGASRNALSNVVVTPNTANISEVYSRSRVVLGLSQWWESGSRVLAEAMLNGIPAIVSNHGGSPEMVGDGGIVVDLPAVCHEPPYNQLPRPELLEPIAGFIEQIWDDEALYLHLMMRALQQGTKLHRMEVSTQRLLDAFEPLVAKRAGDGDQSKIIRELHKHNLFEEKVVAREGAEVSETAPDRPESDPFSKKDPDEIIADFLEENQKDEHLPSNFGALRENSTWLTLVHPGGDWILEKMAGKLSGAISGSQCVAYRDLDLSSADSPLNNPNGVNYYIHYNLFERKSKGIDVAWFTHIEEKIPPLREKFFSVAEQVDYGIFNSQKYLDIVGLPSDRASVVIPGVDEEFFSRRLVLGVIGRNYDYTDRKNFALVERVSSLPYVDLRFTGGDLSFPQLVEFYRSVDYVFTASTIEGGPMSLLEGMASGKRSIFPRGVGLWANFSEEVISYDLDNFAELEGVLRSLHEEKMRVVDVVADLTWQTFVESHIKIFNRLREGGRAHGGD